MDLHKLKALEKLLDKWESHGTPDQRGCAATIRALIASARESPEPSASEVERVVGELETMLADYTEARASRPELAYYAARIIALRDEGLREAKIALLREVRAAGLDVWNSLHELLAEYKAALRSPTPPAETGLDADDVETIICARHALAEADSILSGDNAMIANALSDISQLADRISPRPKEGGET